MNFDRVRELSLEFEREKIKRLRSLPPCRERWESHYGTVQFVTNEGWIFNVSFNREEWDYFSSVAELNRTFMLYEDLPADLKPLILLTMFESTLQDLGSSEVLEELKK